MENEKVNVLLEDYQELLNEHYELNMLKTYLFKNARLRSYGKGLYFENADTIINIIFADECEAKERELKEQENGTNQD